MKRQIEYRNVRVFDSGVALDSSNPEPIPFKCFTLADVLNRYQGWEFVHQSRCPTESRSHYQLNYWDYTIARPVPTDE